MTGMRRELWGPQSASLFIRLRKIWKSNYSKALNDLKKSFVLENPETGEYSVDKALIKKSVKSISLVSKDVWTESFGHVQKSIGRTYNKSRTHFEKQKQSKTVRKQDGISEDEWRRLVEMSIMEHMELFTRAFPDRILVPEIDRMLDLFVARAETDIAAMGSVIDRLQRIDKFVSGYLYNLTDVNIGRVWNFAGVDLAHDLGVGRAMIVAIRDAVTCPVCIRLDGKVINVQSMYDRILDFMRGGFADASEVVSGWPLPRIADVDNVSPRQITDAGHLPPFHNKCRCDVVFLW